MLDQADANELLNPLFGECISSPLVRELLRLLSDDLIERGYVTTRPYLAVQDISDGDIDVRVLVGRIEAIVDAQSEESSIRLDSAFAFTGPVLNLRELETALEAIERPRSVQANFEIRPGSGQGDSIVAVETVDASPLAIEIGANARTDADPQASFGATLDNPLKLNDILEFRYNDNDTFQAYQSERSREWYYSLGFSRYLLSYSYRDLTYRQRLQGIGGSFVAKGDSESHRLELGRLMARGQAWRLDASLNLELEDSSNFFDGEEIDVSSYRTSKAGLELNHQWYASWGLLYSRYAYQQGLDSFGARDDSFFSEIDADSSAARLQFSKHVVETRLNYYLPRPGWQAGFNFHGQYSDDLLFDADKLFLGSENTVRGYTSALSGANGWYTRVEAIRRFQSAGDLDGTLFKTVSLAFGLDYGDIRCEADNPDLCGDIYGFGAGVTITDDNFNALLSWGHPLKERDDGIGDEDVFLLDLRFGF